MQATSDWRILPTTVFLFKLLRALSKEFQRVPFCHGRVHHRFCVSSVSQSDSAVQNITSNLVYYRQMAEMESRKNSKTKMDVKTSNFPWPGIHGRSACGPPVYRTVVAYGSAPGQASPPSPPFPSPSSSPPEPTTEPSTIDTHPSQASHPPNLNLPGKKAKPQPPKKPNHLRASRAATGIIKTTRSIPTPWSQLPPLSPDRIIDLSCFQTATVRSDQLQSPFLSRLPLEIRCRVYELVLPAERRIWVRHVSAEQLEHIRLAGGLTDGKTGERAGEKGGERPAGLGGKGPYLEHFPCAAPPKGPIWEHDGVGPCCATTYCSFFDRTARHGVQPHRDAMALMGTCQKVYVFFSIFLCPLPSSPSLFFFSFFLNYLLPSAPFTNTKDEKKKRYSDLFNLWHFCFVDLATLSTVATQPDICLLPGTIRQVQLMLYPPAGVCNMTPQLHWPLEAAARGLDDQENEREVPSPRMGLNVVAQAERMWKAELAAVADVCGRMEGLVSLLLKVHPTPRFSGRDDKRTSMYLTRVVGDLEAVVAGRLPDVRVRSEVLAYLRRH